jgi:hypothetical protein
VRICQVLLFLLVLALNGCAYLGSSQKEDPLALSGASKDALKQIDSTQISGLSNYEYKKIPFKSEWITCTIPKASGSMLVMHRDRAGFSSKTFCNGWIAQSFLNAGFNVITVNRPGFGNSSGTSDFAGPLSVAAIGAGLKAALKANSSMAHPFGIWGYSSGATAAALFAKHAKLPKLNSLILGGGLYDLEEIAEKTDDSYIKKEIAAVKKTGGDAAVEYRSIGYDVAGLPKSITIYHGKNDKTAPIAQAKNFHDSLKSEEYRVKFQVVNKVGHNIPVGTHVHILKVLAHSAKSAAK